MYDLIGAIHAHGGELTELLEALGYSCRHRICRHLELTAVFVGDFIDRGSRIREVLGIVRPMCEACSALDVMGNREFNALAFHTPAMSARPRHDKTAPALRLTKSHISRSCKNFPLGQSAVSTRVTIRRRNDGDANQPETPRTRVRSPILLRAAECRETSVVQPVSPVGRQSVKTSAFDHQGGDARITASRVHPTHLAWPSQGFQESRRTALETTTSCRHKLKDARRTQGGSTPYWRSPPRLSTVAQSTTTPLPEAAQPD